MQPATVAVVGRPNVGKSALFNRLIGQRLAIVEDTPGVTRDRLYGLCEWQGRTFSLVDTAGIDPDQDKEGDHIAVSTRRQAEAAANQADAIIFVVDAQSGRHPLDEEVAAILRRTRHPVVLVANKAESPNAAAAALPTLPPRETFKAALPEITLINQGTIPQHGLLSPSVRPRTTQA
ncbi:MAG: GTPase, partial [Candidatus Baltobacteraceae bacterium]